MERQVLIVEDEALIALDIEETLRDEGCTIIGPASSVDEALSLLQSAKPDLAFLDINLGAELVFPVADVLCEARVPFIFITGHSAHVLPENYRDRPLVTKPFLARDLTRALSHVQDPRPRAMRRK